MQRPAVPIVVLVTGLPGTGKTTVAGTLSPLLGLPLVSKDVIKETLWDVLADHRGDEERGDDWRRALGRAARLTTWQLLRDSTVGAVIDDNLLADDRDQVARELGQTRVRAVHEVWCHLPVEQARRRFDARARRHPVHRTVTDADWQRWASLARPLEVGTLHPLSTAGDVDVPALARRIQGRA